MSTARPSLGGSAFIALADEDGGCGSTYRPEGGRKWGEGFVG